MGFFNNLDGPGSPGPSLLKGYCVKRLDQNIDQSPTEDDATMLKSIVPPKKLKS